MRFGNASNRASLPRVQGGFSAERRPSRCDLVVRRSPEFAHFAAALLCAVKLSERLAAPEFCALGVAYPSWVIGFGCFVRPLHGVVGSRRFSHSAWCGRADGPLRGGQCVADNLAASSQFRLMHLADLPHFPPPRKQSSRDRSGHAPAQTAFLVSDAALFPRPRPLTDSSTDRYDILFLVSAEYRRPPLALRSRWPDQGSDLLRFGQICVLRARRLAALPSCRGYVSHVRSLAAPRADLRTAECADPWPDHPGNIRHRDNARCYCDTVSDFLGGRRYIVLAVFYQAAVRLSLPVAEENGFALRAETRLEWVRPRRLDRHSIPSKTNKVYYQLNLLSVSDVCAASRLTQPSF